MKKWRIVIVKAPHLNNGQQHWRVYSPTGPLYYEARSIDYAMWKIETYLAHVAAARSG